MLVLDAELVKWFAHNGALMKENHTALGSITAYIAETAMSIVLLKQSNSCNRGFYNRFGLQELNL
jgi:hypothetical protein